jgi:hypothetical protein
MNNCIHEIKFYVHRFKHLYMKLNFMYIAYIMLKINQ